MEKKKNYKVLVEIDFIDPVFKNKKFVEFKTSTYKDRYLQIRKYKKIIKFYEIDMGNDKEIPLSRETVEWLVDKKRFSNDDRKKIKKFLWKIWC